jgi:6-phosphogluconolactonase/glucosamine-6-phosphate isomerase/deaminase
MNLNIKKNFKIEEIADIVATSINSKLEKGINILWFVSGGSVIPTQVLIAKKITKHPVGKLIVTLADERYGEVNHKDSNWFKLIEAGFDLPQAKLIPILKGKDISETTNDFKNTLNNELNNVDFKIGIFGIGIDGHTAGILPKSGATSSNDIVYTYKPDAFNRITITPKIIYTLDEAILYAMDNAKLFEIEKLKTNLTIEEQPAQALKKVPLLTVFTN